MFQYIIKMKASISEWIDRTSTLVVNLHFFFVVLQENQEEMVFQEVRALQEVLDWMAEMEGKVHREPKVTFVICLFEGTEFERC